MSESEELLTLDQDKTLKAFRAVLQEYGANSGYQVISRLIDINGEIRASISVVAVCNTSTVMAIREFIEDLARDGQFGEKNVHQSDEAYAPSESRA